MLFLKERKSNSLFCALFKRAKEQIALLRSFRKERKSKLLFFALFEKSEKANRSLALFLKRAKERIAPWRTFWKERKSEERKSERAIAQPWFFSVLQKEHSVFFFFYWVFDSLWKKKNVFRFFQKNGKVPQERNILFKRTKKNGLFCSFFGTEWSFLLFIGPSQLVNLVNFSYSWNKKNGKNILFFSREL